MTSNILLVEKILILFFKLGQAQQFGIESYQKKYRYEHSLCGRQKVNIVFLTKLCNTESRARIKHTCPRDNVGVIQKIISS